MRLVAALAFVGAAAPARAEQPTRKYCARAEAYWPGATALAALTAALEPELPSGYRGVAVGSLTWLSSPFSTVSPPTNFASSPSKLPLDTWTLALVRSFSIALPAISQEPSPGNKL